VCFGAPRGAPYPAGEIPASIICRSDWRWRGSETSDGAIEALGVSERVVAKANTQAPLHYAVGQPVEEGEIWNRVRRNGDEQYTELPGLRVTARSQRDKVWTWETSRAGVGDPKAML
jgi:hypothetical protein